MFDIRDHGGIFGAGKYRKGSKIPVANTLEKVAVQILSKVYQQTSLLRDCLGDDNTNYYYLYYTSGYKICVVNKSTDNATYTVDTFLTPIMYLRSINDGYVYVFLDTTLKKININTGSVVWSLYTNYSASDSNSISISIDSTHVYLSFRNNGFSTTVVKATIDGVLVFNKTISIASKFYYLEGTIVYSISTDGYTLYKHDISTGTLISQTSVQVGNAMAVDYKNGTVGIGYSFKNPNIIATRFDGLQMWTYNISVAQPRQIIAMKDGIYIGDYSGRDIKLGIDGKMMYKNYQPYPSGLGNLIHEYGKDYLLGNSYAYNGSAGYYTPTKVQEYITLK